MAAVHKIPQFGLGTYLMLDEPKDAGMTTEESVKYAIEELDIMHIDAAVLYKTEAAIGRVIEKIKSKVPRKKLFITTKVHNRDQKKGPNRIRRVFEESKKKLETPYVDLLLLHAPMMSFLEASWKVLEDLHLSGECKMIGVSNFDIEHLEWFKTNSDKIRVKPMVNQIELSPFNTKEDLVKYCNNNDIIVVAHSSLTRGKKLDHQLLKEIGDIYNFTPAQVMLKWAIQKGFVIIPKSNIKKEINENYDAYKSDIVISDEDIKRLDNLNENFTLFNKYDD
jgi:diketogulonate reductase-like aldo/keto reductase